MFFFLFFFLKLIFCNKNFISFNKPLINLVTNLNKFKFNNVSNKCLDLFNKTLFINSSEHSNIYKNKFLFSSSKNKNNLISFYKCNLKKKFYKNFYSNTIFVVLIIQNNKNNENLFFNDFYLQGICLPFGCDLIDYKNFIKSLNTKAPQLLNINNNLNNFDVLSIQNEKKFKLKNILNFIPTILFFIQILFVFLPKIPRKILIRFNYIFCRFKKKNSLNYYKKLFRNVKNIFKFKENSDEFFSNSNKSINDNGLIYLIGLRSFNLIFYVIGTVFIILINSPIKNNENNNNFNDLIKNPIIFYSVRFSPKILLSISGAILTLKLNNFLESKIDDDNNEENEKKFEINLNCISLNNKSNLTKDDDDIKYVNNRESINIMINERKNMSFKFLFKFIFYQFHKYLMFVFSIFFFRYNLYFVNFNKIEPFWEFFYHKIIIKINFFEIVKKILLIDDFFFNDYFNKNFIENFLNYYYLIFNEIFSFIISTIILFFVFKKNLNFNLICIILIFVLILIKIVLCVFIKKFSALQYYNFFYFGKYFISNFNNYIFYLIGNYFGFFIFIVQKQYSIKKCKIEEKNYLIKFSILSNKIYNKKKIILILFSYFMLFLIILLNFINYFPLNSNEILKFIKKNFLMNIDIEIGIILLHLSFLFIYIKDENFLFNFFQKKFWLNLHQIYFSFLISIIPISFYFIYNSSNIIIININNILFYSIIITIVTNFFSILLHIIVEVTYKKLIKFLININNEDKNILNNSSFISDINIIN